MNLKSPTLPDPEQLRPVLHEEIDRLPVGDLEVLYRVALQFELDNLAEELDEEFHAIRKEGKLENIAELIQAARTAIHPQDFIDQLQNS